MSIVGKHKEMLSILLMYVSKWKNISSQANELNLLWKFSRTIINTILRTCQIGIDIMRKVWCWAVWNSVKVANAATRTSLAAVPIHVEVGTCQGSAHRWSSPGDRILSKVHGGTMMADHPRSRLDPAWDLGLGTWDLGLDPARPTRCLLHVCPRGASYYDLVLEEQITTCNFDWAQKHNKDQN